MSGGTSRSNTGDLTPKEYRKLRGPFAGYLTDYLTRTPEYEGDLVAGLGDAENEILARLRGPGNRGAGRDISRAELISTIQGDSSAFQPELDEAVNLTLRDLAVFGDEQNLETRALFNRAGQTLSESSPFARAAALNNRALADAAQKAVVGIRLPALMQERQNQLDAIGLLEGLNESELQQEIANLEAQSLPRLVADAGITRGIDLFKEREGRLIELMRILAGITTPTPQPRSHSAQGGVL